MKTKKSLSTANVRVRQYTYMYRWFPDMGIYQLSFFVAIVKYSNFNLIVVNDRCFIQLKIYDFLYAGCCFISLDLS